MTQYNKMSVGYHVVVWVLPLMISMTNGKWNDTEKVVHILCSADLSRVVRSRHVYINTVSMAINDINSREDILPGITLVPHFMDSMVSKLLFNLDLMFINIAKSWSFTHIRWHYIGFTGRRNLQIWSGRFYLYTEVIHINVHVDQYWLWQCKCSYPFTIVCYWQQLEQDVVTHISHSLLLYGTPPFNISVFNGPSGG